MDALSLNAGITIRPICAADAPRLGRLLERCSAQTTYRRYFTPMRRPRPWTLQDQTNLDHSRREALVAACADEIVGMAQYETLAGRDSLADVAVLVEDAWQRRGLGTALLTRISVLAASRGVGQFTAAVLSSNTAALGLLHKLFARVDVREQGYSCDIRIALPSAVSPGTHFDRSAIASTVSMSATLLGVAGAADPRGQTPAAGLFRCGHQLGQHAPDAARYCRDASWKPAFDPATLLAVPTPREAG